MYSNKISFNIPLFFKWKAFLQDETKKNFFEPEIDDWKFYSGIRKYDKYSLTHPRNTFSLFLLK